jgi:suppressor of fused
MATHQHGSGCGCASTPGVVAIDTALAAVYGATEPDRYASPPIALGGDGAIEQIAVYRADAPRHWHLVSYGLTELHRKESADAHVSGTGFELTFRVARGDEDDAPVWAIDLVQTLASYVRASGRGFAAGQHVDLGGPLSVDEDTLLRAVAFVRDPVLGRIDTPHGAVDFLQIVGVTVDELAALRAGKALFEARTAIDPLHVTDVTRASWLDDAAFAAGVRG